MKLIDIAVELFTRQLGGSQSLSSSVVKTALDTLMGDGKGGINLQNIISRLGDNGLATLASSWLGNNENANIGTDDIVTLFGGKKIAQFASLLNLSEQEATNGLAEMLPKLVDRASSNGELLESSVGSILNRVTSFF